MAGFVQPRYSPRSRRASVPSPAAADTIHIGVSVSATGPAASLGIPEKNTIALLPKEIGGQNGGVHRPRRRHRHHPRRANTRKLIDEDHVDAMIGSTVTPNSLAMARWRREKGKPLVSMAASAR